MIETRLVEIPRDDWAKLRDLYAASKLHISTYNTLQNYINYFQRNPSIDYVHVYSLNNDWQSDGTFIIQDNRYIHFNTLNESDDERLFMALSLLDYTLDPIFNGYPNRLQDIVDRIIKRYDLCTNEKLNGRYDMYVLPNEKALDLSKKFRPTPEGITFAPLCEKNALIANKTWTVRNKDSLELLERLIRNGPSLGAFNENGELIAWVMFQLIGALGVVEVREDYRQRGLGTLLVSKLSHQIAHDGWSITATISPQNTPSIRMFEGLGFEKLPNILYCWMFLHQRDKTISKCILD